MINYSDIGYKGILVANSLITVAMNIYHIKTLSQQM